MAEKYEIWVDDNFHFMDEDERYYFGWFERKEDAEQAAKLIIEDELISWAPKYDSSDELLSQYKSFGEDPFGSGVPFSAWDWAEKRCKEIVAMTAEELEQEKARHERDWKRILELRRKD